MALRSWPVRTTLLAVILLLLTAASVEASPPTARLPPSPAQPPSKAQLDEAYGRLPLHFEENRGQADSTVRFIAHTAAGRVLLTSTGFVLALDGPALRLSFAGATAEPTTQALDLRPGRVNYYLGQDPQRWHTDIPTYGRVRYAEVYAGIDVVVYGNQRQLEYDVVVGPGADPGVVRVRVEGAEALHVDASGDLRIQRGDRTIVQRAPMVYQERDGRREPVNARYVLRQGNEVAFDIGVYDRSRPLFIDPLIAYSARIGPGTAVGIAVDSAGYAYFAGNDGGSTYPQVNPAYQQSAGYVEMFVTKLSPNGDSLIYSTFIGSFWHDQM